MKPAKQAPIRFKEWLLFATWFVVLALLLPIIAVFIFIAREMLVIAGVAALAVGIVVSFVSPSFHQQLWGQVS